ncbi:MAG TPA: low specificity L-threonine aldolase [Pyrinomonadaceae bacterium]|jgi:threonine aldolase|nr:low specificity L-threonine aldolase [Pyrinomonadaceae bacterium]
MKRGFASDNNAGVHPRVMDAVRSASRGHAVAYGDDPFTEEAVEKFREQFGASAEVFFVFGGTGANVCGLAAVTRPHQAVVCAATAHVNVDECGAPEKFAGCKLLTLPTPDGKLKAEQVEPLLVRAGDQHHVQPRVVSVSQATELGTVYTAEELKRLAEFAHARGLLLHVDGARLVNAAAHLGVSLRELTAGAGVDVLSFGGTKNGMMYGEAVVFFDASLARDFKFVRKQGAQLPSKMRFIAAQFNALFTEDLWLQNAAHANRMAHLLAAELEQVPQVRVTQPVESNAVFALLPRGSVAAVQQQFFFYVWNEETSEVRLMCSFDTTEEDVRELVRVIREVVG